MKQTILNLISASRTHGGAKYKRSVFFTLERLTWLQRIFPRRSTEVTTRVLNYKVSGYYYSIIGSLFREIFVDQDYRWKFPSTEPIVIDCGANIGMSVMYFRKMFPYARIIAFEANPHAFRLLQVNLQQNDIRDVSLINRALYDREGEIDFFTGDNKAALSSSVIRERTGSTQMKVQTAKLSDYIYDIHLRQRSILVKMDVEGAEHKIIKDLEETDQLKWVDQFIIEYHNNIPGESSTLWEFLQRFDRNGFAFEIKTGSAWTTDILIHFYKK